MLFWFLYVPSIYIVNSPMLPFLISILLLLLFVAFSCIQNHSFLFDTLAAIVTYSLDKLPRFI